MRNTERPEWVPDDVLDEHVGDYAGSFGGTLARLAWEEKRLTGVAPRSDQVSAHVRAKRDEQLGRIRGSNE